jgi:CxxC-x17-CxxC domain-containing protein
MNNFSRGGNSGGGFGGNKGAKRSFGGGFGGGSRGGFKPRFNRNDGDEREMFDATCGECGNDCQVPFRPNGRKPVLCSNCFRKEEGGNDRGPRSFGNDRFSNDRPSYGEKRSFNNDRFGRGTEGKPNDERLQSIEAKLDVILSQLRRLNRDKKNEGNESNDENVTVDTLDLGE